jgi:crossover junction endodeoxyribonuclease RuvC
MAVELSEVIAELTAFAAKVSKNDLPIHMGVDPGATGAIAFLCGKLYVVVDIPVMTLSRRRVRKTTKKERRATGAKTKTVDGTTVVFDYQGLVKILRPFKPLQERIFATVEMQQVQNNSKLFKQTLQTSFRVGVSYGMWPMLVALKHWASDEPAPSVWKQKMGLRGKDKAHARRMAQRLFPKAPLTRIKDHNRAEALLLALYGQRVNAGKL